MRLGEEIIRGGCKTERGAEASPEKVTPLRKSRPRRKRLLILWMRFTNRIQDGSATSP